MQAYLVMLLLLLAPGSVKGGSEKIVRGGLGMVA